jgi:glycerol dehydrogenase-like iron-containing ADH family enzyme
MTVRKRRLTVTVDPELVEAGARAVASGEADSLSGWVSAAMADRAHRDQKLKQLRDAIGSYEAEFGEITTEELQAQRRADRDDALVVRGGRPPTGRRPRRTSARPA